MGSKRVLVTGISGFIAPRLASQLVERGYEVWGLSRYVAGRSMYREDHRISRFFADLNDHRKIQIIINALKPDTVFHLAAMSPVSYSYENPVDVNRTNYLATVNLAEACRQIPNFQHFIFAGSSEEYGIQPKFPIREDATLYPNSPYSASKVAADQYLMFMRDAYDFPATVARPFNTYGRVYSRHFVVERTVTQLIPCCGEVRLGDPRPIRDFLYVSDHVSGYLAVMHNREAALGKQINFCTGRGVSIEHLVDMVREHTRSKARIVWNSFPARPLDIPCLIGDNGLAKRGLGWTPKVTLEAGLWKTVDALQKLK